VETRDSSIDEEYCAGRLDDPVTELLLCCTASGPAGTQPAAIASGTGGHLGRAVA
jgi:hypothetical protein